MRNDPDLRHVGAPAVTGTARLLRAVQGNGAAVDFRGDVTTSEGVVWGYVTDPCGRSRHSAPRADRAAGQLRAARSGGLAAAQDRQTPHEGVSLPANLPGRTDWSADVFDSRSPHGRRSRHRG